MATFSSHLEVEDCSTSKADQSSVREKHSPLSRGRSENGPRGDYEIVEYNDSNGQYLVMKQRLSRGDLANSSEVLENGEFSQSTVDSTPTDPTSSSSASGSLSTLKSTNNVPTSLTPDRHVENKKWRKSPSSPVFPVKVQSSTPVLSDASTPNHLAIHQTDLLTPGTPTHSNDPSRSGFTPDEAGSESAQPTKQISRKKKRSASWYTVINPSSKQKNETFHKLFKQIPDSEQLMLDYTCALMKEILVQGKLYVSQNYVCFHSNILKWQTAMIMNFEDIEQISKERTVKLFPNAIQFRVKGREKPPTFTSFTQRDRAFLLISKLLKNSRKEKPLPAEKLLRNLRNNSSSALASSDEEASKPNSPLEPNSNGETRLKTFPSQESKQMNGEDKTEEVLPDSSSSSAYESSNASESSDEREDDSAELGADGLPVHAKEDLEKPLLSREYAVPAEIMFKTLFDPECPFFKDHLIATGSFDIVLGRWEDGTDDNEEDQVKKLSYHISITNPLGPKSAKVEELQIFYKESIPGSCYAVDCVARTLGVPYSNYFDTVMRYCIRRLSDTKCELRISAKIDYRKQPWGVVKNFIQKNVYVGMDENFRHLEKGLESYFAEHSSRLFYVAPDEESSGRTRLKRKKKKKCEVATSETPTQQPDKPASRRPSASQSNHEPQTFASSCVEHPPSDSLPQEWKSGKLLKALIAVIFLSLLWNNYRMYERLNVLEEIHYRSTSADQLYSHVYETPRDGPRDDCSIVNRVNNLENLIQKHVRAVDNGWHYILKEWRVLRDQVDEAVKNMKRNGLT